MAGGKTKRSGKVDALFGARWYEKSPSRNVAGARRRAAVIAAPDVAAWQCTALHGQTRGKDRCDVAMARSGFHQKSLSTVEGR